MEVEYVEGDETINSIYNLKSNNVEYRVVHKRETGRYDVYVKGDVYIESSASQLQPVVATWYKALRAIALVGLLSVLVYVGIRIIISSTGQEKAKYKKMIGNWLTAICILFILQYIMVFTLEITQISVQKPNKIISLLKSSFCNNLSIILRQSSGFAPNVYFLSEYANPFSSYFLNF